METPGRGIGGPKFIGRESQAFAGTLSPSGYCPVMSAMLFWLLCVGTTTRENANVPRAINPLRLGAFAIQRPARPWSSMSISIVRVANGDGGGVGLGLPLLLPQATANNAKSTKRRRTG